MNWQVNNFGLDGKLLSYDTTRKGFGQACRRVVRVVDEGYWGDCRLCAQCTSTYTTKMLAM